MYLITLGTLRKVYIKEYARKDITISNVAKEF